VARIFEWRVIIFLAEWMVSAGGKLWRDLVLAWHDFWIRPLYLVSYASIVTRLFTGAARFRLSLCTI